MTIISGRYFSIYLSS